MRPKVLDIILVYRFFFLFLVTLFCHILYVCVRARDCGNICMCRYVHILCVLCLSGSDNLAKGGITQKQFTGVGNCSLASLVLPG